MSEPDFKYDPPPMPIVRDMVCISRIEYNKLRALANTLGEQLESAMYRHVDRGQETRGCNWCEMRNGEHWNSCPYGTTLAAFEAAKKEGIL